MVRFWVTLPSVQTSYVHAPLQDLISLGDSRADPFILPIVQGYVELMHAPLDLQVKG